MAMQYLLDANGYLTGVYDGPNIIPDATMIPPTHSDSGIPRFLGGAWVVPGTLQLLTPMTLYMAFTPAERIAIKASKDPMVIEFWAMYLLSVQLDKPTDPNLVSVQEAIAYLAQKPSDTPPGPGIITPSRIPQILAGTPQ